VRRVWLKWFDCGQYGVKRLNGHIGALFIAADAILVSGQGRVAESDGGRFDRLLWAGRMPLTWKTPAHPDARKAADLQITALRRSAFDPQGT
jgi:hypothetical protein